MQASYSQFCVLLHLGPVTPWVFETTPTYREAHFKSAVRGQVSSPDGGEATEDVAASQHDDERHKQEGGDDGQGDEQKEA